MTKNVYKILITCLFFIFFTIAHAQDDDVKMMGALQNILNEINENLKDFSERYLDYNFLKMNQEKKYEYESPPLEHEELEKIKEPAATMIKNMRHPENSDVYNTILHVGLVQDNPIINASTQSIALSAIQDILTTPNECRKDLQGCKSRDMVIAEMAELPISSPYNKNGDIDAESFTSAKKDNPANKALDLNALLGPLGYSRPQGGEGASTQPSADTEMALNFIKFVTEQSIPIQLKGALKGTDSSNNKYIVQLRNYISHESIDVSNFYAMAARRIKMPVKSKKDTNENGVEDFKSQLEMEHEMATRRLSTGEWHDEMEKVPPQIIQREILYLLAEINYQLYLSRLEQERLLATVTAYHAMQLQSTVKLNFSQMLGPMGGGPYPAEVTPGTVTKP